MPGRARHDERGWRMRIALKRGGGGTSHLPPWLGKKWVRWLLALLGLLVIACTIFWYLFIRGLPSTDALLAYEPPLPTNVRSIDGTPVYSFARERRVELGFDELPKPLIQAFISAEDKTFFRHKGVNPLTFLNGVYEYVTKYGSGERAHGGSTITQQLAKNLLIGDEYSPSRKIREAVLADPHRTGADKEQILELYLNQIFLGRNAYGVQSAARAYFGKDVDHLTLPETAYLAILPKAPSNYDPDRHEDRAKERRAYVLREMHANGYITAEQEAAADAAPLGTVPRSDAKRDIERQFEGHFMEEVRRELIDRYGEADEKGSHGVYTGGLWVRSSLNPVMQKAAEQALRQGLLRYRFGGRLARRVGRDRSRRGLAGRDSASSIRSPACPNGVPPWSFPRAAARRRSASWTAARASFPPGAPTQPKRGVGGRAFDFLKAGDVVLVARSGDAWALRSIPVVSGGFVAENPHTGQVLAMQGGFDPREPFNRATQALRQPGSAFKPIVYSAALDSGMTPASIIDDAPFCVFQTASLGTKCFRNFSGGYAGPQTMRWGVEQSRNLMTVRAATQTGMDKVVALAKAMGVGDLSALYRVFAGRGRDDRAAPHQRLCDARQSGPQPEADAHRLRAGSPRQGHLARGHAPVRRLQREGLEWRRMPRPALRGAQVLDADDRLSDGPHHGGRRAARHGDGAARSRPADVRQDRHELRPHQRVVRRRIGRSRGRRLSRLRQAPAARRLCAGRHDRRADLPPVRPGGDGRHARRPVQGAARHPHGPHRSADRQEGVFRLARSERI
jgi:penicillin-binding protein 1A